MASRVVILAVALALAALALFVVGDRVSEGRDDERPGRSGSARWAEAFEGALAGKDARLAGRGTAAAVLAENDDRRASNQWIKVEGVVLIGDASPADVRVEAYLAGSSRLLATAGLGDHRRFELDVPVATSATKISVRAVSGVPVMRLSASEQLGVGARPPVFLRLEPSALLRVDTIRGWPAGASRPEYLVQYLGADGPMSIWASARGTPTIARQFGSIADGSAEMSVLPGRYMVYARVPGGAFGPPEHVVAAPGQPTDVVVAAAGLAGSVVITVRDETGRSVPDAWIGFSLEEMYRAADAADGQQAGVYLRTDDRGNCRIDGLPLDRAVSVSVGSPWHEILPTQVRAPESQRVTLRRLPRRKIVLAHHASYLRSWTGQRPPPRPRPSRASGQRPVGGVRSAEDRMVRDVGWSVRTLSDRQGRWWLVCRAAGTYAVTARLYGGIRVADHVEVRGVDVDPPHVFHPPDLREIQLRLSRVHPAVGAHERARLPLMVKVARGHDGPPRNGYGRRVLLEERTRMLDLAVPRAATHLAIEGRRTNAPPLEPVIVALPEKDVLIDVAVDVSPAGVLDVSVEFAGASLAHARVLVRGAGAPPGHAAACDERGRCRFVLAPGHYMVGLSTGVREPDWQIVELAGSTVTRVSLSEDE